MSKPVLSQDQLKHLANVIGEMEQKTSGEMRLMIVKRSSMIGHVPFLIWTILVSFSIFTVLFIPELYALHEEWWIWPAIFVVNYGIAWALAHSRHVQRLCIPHEDQHHQVWARAEVEFGREILGQTRGRTGILLFLSEMERQAVVMADKGVASKIPAETWDKVIGVIVQAASTGHWAERLEEALRICGGVLASHLPQELDDSNELPNEVILKD